ncbi:Heparin-binding growth factor 2 [Chelonia mydas]|uniref:Heparin-binding growth factor 2 n=1 Tax=Chelonia mydas TaxID=8469 RepID=M7BS40_CHEMY|nr:Heparin-binding growth factor 2 [Chelonia mydas]
MSVKDSGSREMLQWQQGAGAFHYGEERLWQQGSSWKILLLEPFPATRKGSSNRELVEFFLAVFLLLESFPAVESCLSLSPLPPACQSLSLPQKSFPVAGKGSSSRTLCLKIAVWVGWGRATAWKCVTEECFFFERLESNNYNTYRSRKYSDWYVALKRTGQYKLGPKTGPGQKAILFLPMSAKS